MTSVKVARKCVRWGEGIVWMGRVGLWGGGETLGFINAEISQTVQGVLGKFRSNIDQVTVVREGMKDLFTGMERWSRGLTAGLDGAASYWLSFGCHIGECQSVDISRAV